MKFRFCGALDCPDWILAEIASLAKLTTIKFRMLCQIVCQGIVDGNFQSEKAEKILIDAGLSIAESKGCLSALSFILKSSTKYECNSTSLNNELQQLGLPSELAQQICKIYDDQQPKIRKSLEDSSFRLPNISEMNGAMSETEDGLRFAQLKLTFDGNPSRTNNIAISSQKLDLLIKDMSEAVSILEELKPSAK